jgi:hypothetical protein
MLLIGFAEIGLSSQLRADVDAWRQSKTTSQAAPKPSAAWSSSG